MAKIKAYQALEAANSIRSLDPVFINDGQKVEKAQSFEFSGEVIWDLSGNLLELQKIVEKIESTRSSLATKHKVIGLDQKKLNSDEAKRFALFQKEMTEILEKEQEVDLKPIKKEDLNLAKNKIPVDTIRSLRACGLIIAQ